MSPRSFSLTLCARNSKKVTLLPIRIKVFGSARSTASEIDAAEQFLSEKPKYNQIYAASTWYHVPRIRLLWLLRHRRRTGSLHLWMFRKCVLKRAALELLKLLLIPLPAGTQDRLGQRMRALGLM